MRKKLLWIAIPLVLMAALAVFLLIISGMSKKQYIRGSESQTDCRQAALDAQYWVQIPPEDIVTECDLTDAKTGEESVLLAAGERLRLPVQVPSDGSYALALTYQTVGNTIVQGTVTITVDAATVKSYVNGVWYDESKAYILDRYNNEVTPAQKKLDVYVTDYIRDCTTVDLEPSVFMLTEGQREIIIENNDQDILLSRVMLTKLPKIHTYDTYSASDDGSTPTQPIIIEGENYIAKSDSYVRTKADINSSCYPYSSFQKLLNAVDYYSWKTAGQRIVWQFEVQEAGWYNLAFHYTQSQKEGQAVYRNVELDGQVPFAEAKEVGFNYTGSNYANHTLQVDGKNAKIYLTAGKHTISMYTSVPSMAPIVEEINAISSELSSIGLDLQQVAGSNADVNRTWDIETYIPGVTEHLEQLNQRLLKVYDELGSMSGTTASSCANLKQAAGIIRQALKRPDKLPTYVEQLSVGSGSATDMLAQLVNNIKEQGMSLDRIYLYGDSYELPAGDAGFFKGLWHGTLRFVDSLMNRDGSYGVSDDALSDPDAITVWVNRPIAYVETLQLMADTQFTPQTGIKVYFSIMPAESKLLLANASNTCPDVALGVDGDRPYQLGARGAAYDLTQFDDFAAFVDETYYAYDLEPFVYDGAIYGMPETKNFYVLMYRTDIMEKLELEVPQTWEDVESIMPVLRRNGMTFFMPLSGATGTKPLGSTAPFFLQYGAELYSEDGLTTELNSEAGIEAFTMLTELYTLYGVQNNAPSFYNNFRYGVMPVGVADFSSYIQMLYAAPEIADKWEITLTPGVMQTDGSINRQQVSVSSSDLIMNSTKKADKAWAFLKWWMSEETQVEFAYTLQTKYGSEYVWNTANKLAFSQMSFTKAHALVIQEQWENSENYRIMPATYMLERELSNAWYQVVNENESPRAALNEAVFTINQEMAIRMQQFGYLDESGNSVKAYDMRSAEEILSEVRNRCG